MKKKIYRKMLEIVCNHYSIDMNKPIEDLKRKVISKSLLWEKF